jgi:hypothetical protein
VSHSDEEETLLTPLNTIRNGDIAGRGLVLLFSQLLHDAGKELPADTAHALHEVAALPALEARQHQTVALDAGGVLGQWLAQGPDKIRPEVQIITGLTQVTAACAVVLSAMIAGGFLSSKAGSKKIVLPAGAQFVADGLAILACVVALVLVLAWGTATPMARLVPSDDPNDDGPCPGTPPDRTAAHPPATIQCVRTKEKLAALRRPKGGDRRETEYVRRRDAGLRRDRR